MVKLKLYVVLVFMFAGLATVSAQWHQTNGLKNRQVNGMARFGTHIFAATADSGIFQTKDGGNSWSRMNKGLSNTNTHFVSVIDSALYTGTDDGLFTSKDSGATWTAVGTYLSGKKVLSAISYLSTLVVGTDSLVYSTSNKGNTWKSMNTGLLYHPINCFIAYDGNTILAGTDNGVYSYSADAAIWGQVTAGLTSVDVKALVRTGTYLYACTHSGGVFVSPVGATISWAAVNAGISNTHTNAIVSDGKLLYLASGDKGKGGIYRMANGGAAWQDITKDLQNSDVQALLLKDTSLYAGTIDAGVWKVNPAAITGIAPLPRVSTLHIYPNPATDMVIISCHEKTYRAELRNMLGETVSASTRTLSTGDNMEIDLAHCAPGYYTLQVYTENGVETGTVVKK